MQLEIIARLPDRVNCMVVDESKSSEIAFNWYTKNYHHPEDIVVLICSHRMPKVPAFEMLSGLLLNYSNKSRESKVKIQKCMEILGKFEDLCSAKNIKYKTIIEDSYHSPGLMICDLAKKNAAHIIVMGQRRITGISQVIFGSISDYVVHNSHIPVFVVSHDSSGTDA